ncbi:MAG TPA: hypothetical protein VKY74_14210 [Chloroflexia bacterium]|nr:hypothetical protein [Chloroflexia bacterium]
MPRYLLRSCSLLALCLLVLPACGGAAPAVSPGLATPVPLTAAPATPDAAVAHLQQTVGVLNQMQGHLLVAGELAGAGQVDQAREQAALPGKELFDPLAQDLAAAGADQTVRAALDRYTAAIGNGDVAAPAAQATALHAIDAAIQAVAGPGRLADSGFQAGVLGDLLTKVEAEYRESLQDGKVTQLEPYQSAYGILQVVRRRFAELQHGLGAAQGDALHTAATALDQLAGALPAAQPPAPAVTATAVEQAADAAKGAVRAATGMSSTPPAGGATIAAARADVQAALALYQAGQNDAAYEQAAAAYLDQVEPLEPDLLKADKTVVPVLEADFKAFRDGIKANQAPATLAALATRLDGELAQAAALLGR